MTSKKDNVLSEVLSDLVSILVCNLSAYRGIVANSATFSGCLEASHSSKQASLKLV